MTTPHPHTSVLIEEILQFFQPVSLHHFVDCTLGAGGHSLSILEAHPEIDKLIGIDQDPIAREHASQRLQKWASKLILIESNFKNFSKELDQAGIHKVDGILMDLGVSSMQLDMPEKGFSFMRSGPLDMRMDPSNSLTAHEIVNTWPEADIARIIRDYGEEKQWRLAARAIVAGRPFETTKQLADTLYPALFRRAKKGIHPLTLTFQALRIMVNRELEVLELVLPQALERLNPGGRLAVITFHSLEDRLVKRFFQHEASDKVNTTGLAGLFLDKTPTLNILTRKPIVPSEEEQQQNPRSRSAKLRVIEKK